MNTFAYHGLVFPNNYKHILLFINCLEDGAA